MTIIVPSCGYNFYNLPQDLFEDEQDGDTSKLDLKLKYTNGKEIAKDSWIIMIKLGPTFALQSLPENITLKNQPRAGYEFHIIATDESKLSASMKLYVKIDKKVFDTPAVRLIITGINNFQNAYTINDKLLILI